MGPLYTDTETSQTSQEQTGLSQDGEDKENESLTFSQSTV